MAKKKAKSKSATPSSSWWKERSKVVAKTTASRPAKPKAKKAKAKKAARAKKGEMYYCEVCGSEVVCVEDSTGTLVCCEEPMCLVC